MKGLSIKSHYAITAMLDLAELDSQAPIQLRIIAERNNFPHNYLEQSMMQLKQAGIVSSTRGSSGGYKLAKNSNQITVRQIIEAIEGKISLNNSQNNSTKNLNFFWENIDNQINTQLEVNLEELLKQKFNKNKVSTYYI